MLGTLARRLRLLGYDTAYARDVEDHSLLVRARAEGRRLLTRDRALAARAGPAATLVVATDLDRQVDDLVRALGLAPDPARFLSRCAACNAPVRPAPREEAAGRVPPAVLARHDAFWACDACGRLYWRGTHVERLEAWARRVLGA